MMSTYAAAVLTTAFVAGLSVMSIGESSKPSSLSVDGAALMRAHQFAIHKGESDHPPSAGTGSFEVGMGPFYESGRVRSFVVNTPDVTQQVTFMRGNDPQESARIIGRLRLEKDTKAVIKTERSGNQAGIPDGKGTIVMVPNLGVTVPDGAVILVTTR